LAGWGLLQEGAINVLAPNKFTSAVAGAFDGFQAGQILETRAGFAAPNQGKRFSITAVDTVSATRSVTVAQSVATAAGSGDEQLFAYLTPIFFLTTDSPGQWVVGNLPDNAPYVELQIVGGKERPYEVVGNGLSFRFDGILDVRLYVPETTRFVGNFRDRCDAIFANWKCKLLFFEKNGVYRREFKTKDETKIGYSISVMSYPYWAVLQR
jgi:hypothetical protein